MKMATRKEIEAYLRLLDFTGHGKRRPHFYKIWEFGSGAGAAMSISFQSKDIVVSLRLSLHDSPFSNRTWWSSIPTRNPELLKEILGWAHRHGFAYKLECHTLWSRSLDLPPEEEVPATPTRVEIVGQSQIRIIGPYIKRLVTAVEAELGSILDRYYDKPE